MVNRMGCELLLRSGVTIMVGCCGGVLLLWWGVNYCGRVLLLWWGVTIVVRCYYCGGVLPSWWGVTIAVGCYYMVGCY